jgi:hypothetical protein
MTSKPTKKLLVPTSHRITLIYKGQLVVWSE